MGQAKSKDSTQLTADADWPYVWALRDPSVLDWKQGLADEEILKIHREQANLPVAILPALYLGNCQCAQDLKKLESLGIRRVLNMAGPLAVPKHMGQEMQERRMKYKVINAEDEAEYPLLERHWDEVHAFLDVDGENEKVLVHCVAGMNRSGLVVAAEHLLSHRDTNVIDTVRHIRRQRGNVALQNEGFQEQLVAFARLHDRLGEAPQPLCARTSMPSPEKRKKNPLDELVFLSF